MTTVLTMTLPAVWKRSRLPGTCSCRLQVSFTAARLRVPEAVIASCRRPANSLMRGSAACASTHTFGSPCGAGAVVGPGGGEARGPSPAAKQALESAIRAAHIERPCTRFIAEVPPAFSDTCKFSSDGRSMASTRRCTTGSPHGNLTPFGLTQLDAELAQWRRQETRST